MDRGERRGLKQIPPLWQFLVAVALLAGFALLVVYMLSSADAVGQVWDRQVYIFGAVEAIVFTAVGWIFGREVHRAGLASARSDAEAAKADADAKAAEAMRYAELATKGRALAAAIESLEMPAAIPPGGRDLSAAAPTVSAASATASLASLRSLAQRLFVD